MAAHGTAVVSDPLSDVVLAVGERDFATRVSETLRALVRPDIVGAYVVDPDQAMRVLFVGGGLPDVPRFPEVAASRYAGRFWKDDPALRRLLGQTIAPNHSAIVRQHWKEIPRGEYRTFCYEQPGMLERVSLCRPFAQGRLILSVYRRTESGRFLADQLGLIERTADVLAAAVLRHLSLARSQATLRPEPHAVIAGLRAWPERLSDRETQACAALLREPSVKDAIRATGLQSSTFITYRKRAFAKLGIGTRAELARLYDERARAEDLLELRPDHGRAAHQRP